MKRFWALMVCVLMLFGCASGEEMHQEQPQLPTLTAVGSADMNDDSAILTFILSVEGKTVSEAQALMDQQLLTLRDTLSKMKIAEDALQNRSYDVNPVNEYHYTKITDTTLLTGYSVLTELYLPMQEEHNAGLIIDAVNASGLDCSYDLTYESTLDQTMRDQALAKALQDAMRKAKLMATAGGFTLRDLVSIVEIPANGMAVVEVTYTIE